jgi:hypothetical protein
MSVLDELEGFYPEWPREEAPAQPRAWRRAPAWRLAMIKERARMRGVTHE